MQVGNVKIKIIMFSEELEELIEIAIADGELTEKKRQILFKRAISEGIDLDEFEMILDSRLSKKRKSLGLGSAPSMQAPPMPPQVPVQPNDSQKVGGINKCPNCGAVVVTGTLQCVECGFTFVNMQGNNSVRRFADMIREIEARHTTSNAGNADVINTLTKTLGSSSRKDEIISAIDTFPIPNSKEDLLEFLCFLKPKAEKNKGNAFSKGMLNLVTYGAYGALSKDKIAIAYRAKYEECLNKARFFLAQDPEFERQLIDSGILQPTKKKRF